MAESPGLLLPGDVSPGFDDQLVVTRCHRRLAPLPRVRNNNKDTIWRGSVLTVEELPPHSGEFNRALSQAGGPTQSQLSHPTSSGHHISMEHRLRRKQLNSDTNASNKTYLKEIQEKRKEDTYLLRRKKKEKEKHFEKKGKLKKQKILD